MFINIFLGLWKLRFFYDWGTRGGTYKGTTRRLMSLPHYIHYRSVWPRSAA